MHTINDFETMEAMRYYNPVLPAIGSSAYLKRQEMIENKNERYIASIKWDGDWAMLIHYTKGHNLIRSRSLSKVTGKFGDYTDKLPHICDEMDKFPDNTVLLAEICWHKYGTTANTVGTILRCLPEKALERQKTEKLHAVVFDMLMYNGLDITELPYLKRTLMIYDVIIEVNVNHEEGVSIEDRQLSTMRTKYEHDQDLAALLSIDANFLALWDSPSAYIIPTEWRVQPDFQSWADSIIDAGGEGLVIQSIDNPYLAGARTAWKSLKLKTQTPVMELKVVGIVEANKDYQGDNSNTWKYWEVQDTILTSLPPQPGYSLHETQGGPDPMWDVNHYSYRPVTKPYFMHWASGVIVDYSGVQVSVTSGMSDDDRAWVGSSEGRMAIAVGEVVANVRAMQENALNSLRHPILLGLRHNDK